MKPTLTKWRGEWCLSYTNTYPKGRMNFWFKTWQAAMDFLIHHEGFVRR